MCVTTIVNEQILIIIINCLPYINRIWSSNYFSYNIYFSCPPSAQKCPPGCSTNGTYSGIPPAKPESSEQREHIHNVLATNNKSKKLNLSNILSNAHNLIDFDGASSR